MSGDYEVPRELVLRVCRAAERRGARVVEDHDEPEGGRFIGTISGRVITLFPKYDSNFAMLFTAAHLYGHLAQLVFPLTAEIERAMALVYAQPRVLAQDEVQCLFDYEWEAAAIGRALLAEALEVDPRMDAEYARMFFADFHYLVGFLETGEAGPAVFERYLRRQPRLAQPVPIDPRPLPDVSKLAEDEHRGGDAIVV